MRAITIILTMILGAIVVSGCSSHQGYYKKYASWNEYSNWHRDYKKYTSRNKYANWHHQHRWRTYLKYQDKKYCDQIKNDPRKWVRDGAVCD